MNFNKWVEEAKAKYHELRAKMMGAGDDVSDKIKEMRDGLDESFNEMEKRLSEGKEMTEAEFEKWKNDVQAKIDELEIEGKKE
jgi:DNA anti-recombination protein RmuC